MIELLREEAEERMKKTVESLKHALVKIRTGRAHTSLLDHLSVPYYGVDTPLKQVANVNVADSRTLSVTPWEKSMVPAVEKAILTSDLGLNPSTSGAVIHVPLPPMTEERRRDMTRVVRHEAETGRVAIRNIRRDSNQQLKAMVKDKEISEDEEHHAEETVQQLTNKFIAQADTLLAAKEAELMEI
ncbi:MAG: ribosome recycling factor [Gammaproteobacteria bacterium]|nr:ribosome recycling factor [Gammaproteobacteria bacterium]